MSSTKCYAVMEPSGKLVPYEIQRRPCGEDDVVIAVRYAGICHSDIHQVRNEWFPGTFPMVPGHEIAGSVIEVGKNVTNIKV